MDSLNINIFNAIILAGIIHGIVFSLVIFFNKKFNSKTNFYLSYTILALAFSNLQYWLLDVGISPGYEDNSLIFVPFEFLMLPFFYIFIKSYLNKKVQFVEKFILFTPFTLSLLYQVIGDRINLNTKIIEFLNLVIEYISIIYSISIILIIFYIVKKYNKVNLKYDIDNVIIKTGWIKRTLILGLALCLLWFLSLNVIDDLINRGFYQYYPLWIGIAFLIYWMGYSAIFQSNILIERNEIRKTLIKKNKINIDSVIDRSELNISKKYQYIQDEIFNNKLYLNPNLTLASLSKKFDLSEGYISQLINKNSEFNFNDYINSLRIGDAKFMLKDSGFDNYTITAIGLESGFNSKSSFYIAFKKFTGKTPSDYKKSVRNL